jgi:uncharacterized protein YbaR (Trm112 family)
MPSISPTSRKIRIVSLPDWFIGLIRCPITGSELMLASPTQLQSLQERQERGTLATKLGRTVSDRPTQGLVSSDGLWFYPIERGIVSLLPDDAVPLLAETQSTKVSLSR